MLSIRQTPDRTRHKSDTCRSANSVKVEEIFSSTDSGYGRVVLGGIMILLKRWSYVENLSGP